MSARILVVDDNKLNVKLLEAKLAKDYYFVSTAANGLEALEAVKRDMPDLILLDIMMPEMDGFETCTRLKADPTTQHIPIVMVTALSDISDRVRGLECGADDFLTKPINDIALMARVRSLLRLKMMMDEWRLREQTAAQFSLPAQDEPDEKIGTTGRVLVLEDDMLYFRSIESTLTQTGNVITQAVSIQDAIEKVVCGDYDQILASLNLKNEDGLYLCAQLRAREATRNIPILLMANEGEINLIAKGLDLGANDYLIRPIESAELNARTRTQLHQKRHYDRLRRNYEHNLSLALVDPLTGAYNRRYLDMHLPVLFDRCRMTKRPLSILSIDLDHFKRVNDTHGHAAGDIVLKEMISRILVSLRPSDLVVRMGGEEFAVIMPETEQKTAMSVGNRLREAVGTTPITIPGTDLKLSVTASFGVASVNHEKDTTSATVLERADTALYRAKETGRNKVVGEDDAKDQTS
ncbi:MAG: PleD family two-component system response regulator [Alphaproteobacteria bacterium]|nr:PleD family two-component system response regulator [Alphaproteobacteria bacterium]